MAMYGNQGCPAGRPAKKKDLVPAMVASSYNRAQPGGGFYVLIFRAAEIWILLYTNVFKVGYGRIWLDVRNYIFVCSYIVY